MTAMTTSDVCACTAIGNSAAVAVAPSKTFRRVMVIKGSSIWRRLIDGTVEGYGKASENGKLLVLEISHQHQRGGMRNGKRQLRRRDHRLRRHAARPEYRNLIGFNRHWVAVVGFCDIGDPDRMRMAEVDRRAMHRWEPRGDLHCADGVCRLEWPHRHHHRTGERPGMRAG